MNTHPETHKVYDHSKLEFLNEVGCDLIKEMREGKIKPVTGREREIGLMIETLCRDTKSNPVLVGEAGVGKTALAEGLAERIYRGQVPDKLQDCHLFSVSASSLIAGCNWYGMIETRIKNLLAEAKNDKVIVFIDEIHTLVGTSPDLDSTRDIGQQLKPALSSGDIRLIGATTDSEYARFIAADAALERRFQPIQVAELSAEQTFLVLKRLAGRFRKRKKIEIPESVLRLVLSYAERFLRNRHFPDKAIDLLEQTVASCEAAGRDRVSAEEAAEVVRRIIGIPEDLSDSLQNIEESIERKKLLDADLSKQFCDILRVSMQGLSISPHRPNAVVFLPGKTADKIRSLAETIAEEIYADRNRIVRINFAEVSDRWEFNQMMGIGGKHISTEAPIAQIAKMPWCVIVCENLESCHHSVQEIWASAIENGFLIGADNKKVYLSDAIILLSAEVPASFLTKPGFSSSENKSEDTAERLEKLFSKSLIKFADFIVFENKLDAPDKRRLWLKDILHENLGKRFIRQGIYLHWDKSLIENLLHKLEESGGAEEWERCVNLKLLPGLLPILEQSETRLSVMVKCEKDVITVETEELPADITEQANFEESLKRGLYKKIEKWLRGLYQFKKEEDFSRISVSDSTMRTEIYFSVWENQLLLSFVAPIADRIDKGSLPYLLEKNMVLRFGKFAVEPDGVVYFEYSMLGAGCTAQSFISVFESIVATARKYKKELRSRETVALTSEWLSDEAADWLESRRVK